MLYYTIIILYYHMLYYNIYIVACTFQSLEALIV